MPRSVPIRRPLPVSGGAPGPRRRAAERPEARFDAALPAAPQSLPQRSPRIESPHRRAASGPGRAGRPRARPRESHERRRLREADSGPGRAGRAHIGAHPQAGGEAHPGRIRQLRSGDGAPAGGGRRRRRGRARLDGAERRGLRPADGARDGCRPCRARLRPRPRRFRLALHLEGDREVDRACGRRRPGPHRARSRATATPGPCRVRWPPSWVGRPSRSRSTSRPATARSRSSARPRRGTTPSRRRCRRWSA